LKTLGNTSEVDIVTFRQRREEATIAALKIKVGKTEDETTRLELEKEIEVHEKLLETTDGNVRKIFEDYVLADKVAHGKYVDLKKDCGDLENKLDTIIDHEEREKTQIELFKKKFLLERHKQDSTRDLKAYVRSQVRQDLLASHGLIWLATAHLVHFRCDACEREHGCNACVHDGVSTPWYACESSCAWQGAPDKASNLVPGVMCRSL
jgi:hypothetical protein